VANFLAVVDPDPTRRAACVSRAGHRLDVLPGLRHGQAAAGDCVVRWAAGRRAPLADSSDDTGLGVRFGEPLDENGSVVDAKWLRRSWLGDSAPQAWDGFYAAFAYDGVRGLVAGADVSGLFPVYYWSDKDVVLVGSSIDAFHAHPSFRSELNPLGLAGVLLTGGLVDGETLWKRVRRLKPGHFLSWSQGKSPREICQYAMLMDETCGGSFSEQVALLDDALDRAVARHTNADDELCLLLSGGRDSRLVAGLAHRRHRRVHALTLGAADDYEMQCAGAVAATLGFSHTRAEDPTGDAEGMARRHVRHEQLANGMANFHTWGMAPLASRCGARVLSGYWVEDFVGGTPRCLPNASQRGSDPFDRILRKLTSYGLGIARVRELLPRDTFGDSVDECIERLRAQFVSRDTDDDRRSWQLDMDHHGRHHAGSTPWRLSFESWPAMLALDRSLIRLCTSFPASTLADRRAQDELLRTRFPALARLPLDRNSHVTDPLTSSLGARVRRYAIERMERMRTTERSPLLDAPLERRRYYRLFDIDSPMWRAVRRLAERGRSHAAQFLDRRVLDELLPSPDMRIELRDPITDSNGLKALIGFLIWSAEHV